MYWFLGKPRSIGELDVKAILRPSSRRSAQILIIDDQDFPFLKILQDHEFSLTKRQVVSHVTDVAEYPIILCDIRGVG